MVKVINEIEDHEIEDAKLQEEIDRNNNNKENSAASTFSVDSLSISCDLVNKRLIYKI